MTWKLWLAFAALCGLSGSAWMLDQAQPLPTAGPARIVAVNAILAISLGVASWRFGQTAGRNPWKLVWASAGAFGLPAILSAGAGGRVSQLTEVLVFLLVPVVVVVAAGHRATRFGAAEDPLRRVAPALAGLAGAALILPFTWPSSLAGQCWFAALVASAVIAALAVVWMHDLLAGMHVMPAAAVVSGTVASLAAVGCVLPGLWSLPAITPGGAAAIAIHLLVIDAPVLLLTVWLLRRLEPVAFAARLPLIALVTVLEGFVLLRPEVTWTLAGGLILMAAGGAGLLRRPGAAAGLD